MARTLTKLFMLPLLFVASTLGDTEPKQEVNLTLKRGSALTAPPTVDIKGDMLIIRFVSSEITFFTVSIPFSGEIDRELMATDGSYYTYDMSTLLSGTYTIGIENIKVAYTGSYIKEY